MNNSTVTGVVEFGEKTSIPYTETRSFSTVVHIDEISLVQPFPRNVGTYVTVDYTDDKKMETYRKLNKMLGGK